VPLFWLKLVLAPALVGAASLLGRRFGSRASGLAASFPIVAGPILLFFAIEQGKPFAAQAAEQTMAGVFSLGVYCLVYARMALFFRTTGPARVGVTLALGWLAFAACTVVLLLAPHGRLFAFCLGSAGLTLALVGLSRPSAAAHPPAPIRFDRDLAIRMVAAAALVLALTKAARGLGPSLSGLLTPFPVASTVLLVAEHAAHGPEAAVRLLRGFLQGMYGFLIFCLAVSMGVVPLGIAGAFTLALLGTLGAQIALLFLASARARQGERESER
jgi:hypothetical protein